MTEPHGCTVAHPVTDELSAQGTEVDVGAIGSPIQRNGFSGVGKVAFGGHQRQPAGEFVGVVDPFGAGKQWITGQRLPAAAQIVDAIGALHKADMRNRAQKAAHVRQDAVFGRIGPELAGDLKLLVDPHRFADVDRAVRLLRCVKQLAEPGMPGAGVVPRAAALGAGSIQPLDQDDRPVGLQPPQQRAQGGAHDPRPDQHDVGLCCDLRA